MHLMVPERNSAIERLIHHSIAAPRQVAYEDLSRSFRKASYERPILDW